MLSTKEKREIGLILGSVLLVAFVGLAVTLFSADKLEVVAGAAVKLNPDVPTYPGALIMLKEYCEPISGSGSCDSLCGERICVPTEENCEVNVGENQCLCCDQP